MNAIELAPINDAQPDNTVRAELRESFQLIDLFMLAGIPVVLIALFALFDGPPSQMILSYENPAWHSTVTAHFVHGSPAHLFANVAAYFIVVPAAYSLALLADRRREFGLIFLIFTLVLPPLLSWSILLATERGIAFGFSGLLMAFVGALPVFIGTFVGKRGRLPSDWDVVRGVFSLGLALIVARTAQLGEYHLALVLAALAIAGIFLHGPTRAVTNRAQGYMGSSETQLAAVGTGAFVVGLAVGFPGSGHTLAGLTSTYVHLMGFTFGFAISYWLVRLADQKVVTRLA